MENENVIGGLVRKRGAIAGEMAGVHDRLKAVQADLVHALREGGAEAG